MLENGLLSRKKSLTNDLVFLMHFDGSFNDEYNHGASVRGGGGLTADRKMFGPQSFLSNYNTSFNLASPPSLADFTIDFWGWRSGPASNYGVMAYTGGNPVNIQLILDYGGTGTIGCYWESGGGIQTSAAGLIPVNQWNHFAWVRKGSTLYCFINGSKKLTANVTGASFTPAWVLGYGTNPGGGFNGYVDEFSISNQARWIDDFIPPIIPYS